MFVAAAHNRRLTAAGGTVITASGQSGPLVMLGALYTDN